MEEFNLNNIMPGLSVTPSSGEIADILNIFSKSPAVDLTKSMLTIAEALDSYRNKKYETASTGNANFELSVNNSVSKSGNNRNSAYAAILKSINANLSEEVDEQLEKSEKANELAILKSIASTDMFYTGVIEQISVDETAEKYLGYEYSGRVNGSAPAISPMRKETGGDSMLFCKQVLNDIGVKWVTRYIDFALQEAELANILIKWPYDYPASIASFKALDNDKQEELETKAFKLMSTKLMKDTDIGLPNGCNEATSNPYYIEAGDIIIDPDIKYAAIVASDQSIYQCTNRTLLSCPYVNSEKNLCPQAKSCLLRQCDLDDNGVFMPKIYGDGCSRYDDDNAFNTGGINIPNDPRNKCISTEYEYGNLHVVHDSVELRRLLMPWPSYIIKTSELVKKLKEA